MIPRFLLSLREHFNTSLIADCALSCFVLCLVGFIVTQYLLHCIAIGVGIFCVYNDDWFPAVTASAFHYLHYSLLELMRIVSLSIPSNDASTLFLRQA